MDPKELQTREKILTTAFSLFLEKGYENTPVQAIIDAVGIAKGTFYHHFTSKEEMLVDLVQGMSRRVVSAIEPILDNPSLDARQKMLAASQAGVAQKIQDFRPETMVLVRQMRSRANRLLSSTIDEISSRWVAPLYARLIRQGVAEGVFRVTDPELSSQFFLGLVMAMKDRIVDLFVEASEGDLSALDRLDTLYASLEEALERLLGTTPGSLPIYTSTDIRGQLARFFPGGNP